MSRIDVVRNTVELTIIIIIIAIKKVKTRYGKCGKAITRAEIWQQSFYCFGDSKSHREMQSKQ